MNTGDAFVAGMAGRALLDAQAQALQAQTREQAYHQYVAAYMMQGYSIEQAHNLVQDFFAEQQRLQAQIPVQRGWSTWALDFKVLVVLAGLFTVVFLIPGIIMTVACNGTCN